MYTMSTATLDSIQNLLNCVLMVKGKEKPFKQSHDFLQEIHWLQSLIKTYPLQISVSV